MLLAGVAVLLLASLVAGLLAWRQAERADDAAAVADARRLAALALDVSDNDRSLLIAVEAVHLDDSPDTRASLLAALSRNPALIGSTHEDDALLAVDVSPDGTRVAAGGKQGTSLYDAVTLERLASSDLATGKLEFRPDGHQLAVATHRLFDPRPVYLLDAVTLEEASVQLGGLPDTPADAWDLDYSADGRFLTASVDLGAAVGGLKTVVLVWDVAVPERPIQRVALGDVWAVALSPDGRLLYVGSIPTSSPQDTESIFPPTGVDVGVTVYDVATGRSLRTNELPLGPGEDASDLLEVSPDGTTLAVSDAQDIVLLDAATLAVKQRLPRLSERTLTLEFSHDGTMLDSADDTGTVRTWDVVAGTQREELHGDSGSVSGLAFSPDDATVYSASDGLLAWDLRGDRGLVRRIAQPEPGDPFSELAVPAPDGEVVAYFDSTVPGERGDTIQFRDVATGRLGDPIATGHSNRAADWRPPDGEQFATSDGDGFVRVWDWRRSELIAERKVAAGYIGGVAYIDDGRRIVVGERSGALFQVDADTLEPVGERVEVDREIRDVFAAPDGRTVLVLLKGDTYASIDLVEGGVLHRSDLRVDPAWLDMSPDGTLLAVGTTTGEVGVVDLGSGEWVKPPTDEHAGWVQRVAYAPDGATFVSSGNDGQVALWDGRTGELLASVVPGAPNEWAAAEFLPDGHTVIVASRDGAVSTWDTRLENWIDFACVVAGRNLTEDEWADAIGDRPYHEICPAYGE
jgi:WD40 repeat protein